MFDRVAKPTYCIPFLKNQHFFGRRDELAVLRQRLLVDQDCQKMSIVGLGGIGKTQVALQFVYEVKEAQPDWQGSCRHCVYQKERTKKRTQKSW
jgi:hypothetical protein